MYLFKAFNNWLCFYLIAIGLTVSLVIRGTILIREKNTINFLKLSL